MIALVGAYMPDIATIEEFYKFAQQKNPTIDEHILAKLAPTIEIVQKLYNPPVAYADYSRPPTGEIVAWASAVYESVPAIVYNSHRLLAATIAGQVGNNNLWIIPTHPRLVYPYSALYAFASLLATEKKVGKRADWILWTDDDVLVPPAAYQILRNAADEKEKPIIAAVGHDRNPPYLPAVWDLDDKRWKDVPRGGTYQVSCTGWCTILLHRSVFDKLPQPWFWAGGAGISEDGEYNSGINPDAWFAFQCKRAGIPMYVCTDLQITHLGERTPINTQTAKAMWKVLGLDK